MNEKTQEKILELIESMAKKFGTTSEYLWGVLVKQAYIAAISELIIILIIAFLNVPLFKYSTAITKETNDEDWKQCVSLVCVAYIIFSIIYLCAYLPDIATGFLNPEYYAYEQVIETIK